MFSGNQFYCASKDVIGSKSAALAFLLCDVSSFDQLTLHHFVTFDSYLRRHKRPIVGRQFALHGYFLMYGTSFSLSQPDHNALCDVIKRSHDKYTRFIDSLKVLFSLQAPYLICVEVLECENKEKDEVPAKLLESSLRVALSEEDLKHDITPPIPCEDASHVNGLATRKLSFSGNPICNSSPSLRHAGLKFIFNVLICWFWGTFFAMLFQILVMRITCVNVIW